MDVDRAGMERLGALGQASGVSRLRLDVPMRSLELRFAQPVDTVVAGGSCAALPGVVHAAPSTHTGAARGMELVDREGLFHLTVRRSGDRALWTSGDAPAEWFVVDTDSWARQEVDCAPGSAPGHGAVQRFDLQPQPQVQPSGDLDERLARTDPPVWWEALHALATVCALGCGPVDGLESVDEDDQTSEASEHFEGVRDALLHRRSEAALALVNAREYGSLAVCFQAGEGLRWWSREEVERWDAWASREAPWWRTPGLGPLGGGVRRPTTTSHGGPSPSSGGDHRRGPGRSGREISSGSSGCSRPRTPIPCPAGSPPAATCALPPRGP